MDKVSMQGDMIAQGWELLLYGMGTVVLFLALLVVATTVMSALVSRYFPEPEPVSISRSPAGQLLTADSTMAGEPELVAVISAAIHQHRNNSKRNQNS
jgi:oxaloacetate decarboxylase (Na+ extruding) subunit gamma